MSFRDQFPDFPASDMPATPANWTDESWSNEPCPFFLASPSIGVYVDYSDDEKREMPDGYRFVAVRMESGQHIATDDNFLFQSDDWQAVLDFVASYVPPVPVAPVDPLRAAAILARDTLREQMTEMFGDHDEGRAQWPETVFWEAYEALEAALS